MSGRPIRRTKNIAQFSIFGDLKELCEENDWYKWFDNASQGIFSKGFKFQSGKLSYSQKGKSLYIMIPAGKEAALDECKIFIKKTGIRTQEDRIAAKEKYNRNKQKGWSAIKRDNDKTMYINRYIDELRKEGKISEDDLNILRHNIYIRLLKCSLTSDRVTFENNKIVTINLE